ncbi:MAG: hypothetical protein HYU62_01705 [Caulobacterales bacterium]|nr:hypothetical protein [Caulobacterales bacterium]
MLRRVVLFAGWVTLILLPVAGAAIGWTSVTMSLRVVRYTLDPVTVTRIILQDLMPALLMIGAGLALGCGCLLMASIDRRLSELEARS